MKKKILIFGVVVLLFLSGWLTDVFKAGNVFRTITPHFNGNCTKISGAPGAEDITIHPRTDVAYISSFDRGAVSIGENGKGAIFEYDLTATPSRLVNLTAGQIEDFQPHGMSLSVDPSGKASLFVVNHSFGGNKIEVFDLIDRKLIHRKTLTHPLIKSPNDIVAVGDNQFYVTNDHGNVSGVGRLLEEYFRLQLSSIVYFDGSGFRTVYTGGSYANGINVSPDGKTIYMASTTSSTVYVFGRDETTGSLNLQEKIMVNTGVDNIEIDRKGDLWIGAHPQMLKFVEHAKDPRNRSPSEVIRLFRSDSGSFEMESVYLNSGTELSGSSVAAVLGRRLLIGAVFEKRFLDCQMR